MDGLRHPVGDQPAEIYWKRRLLAVLGIVGVIAFVWVLIAAATGGDGKGSESTPGASPDATTSAAAASDSTDAARACGASDVTITTTANPATVAEDVLPAFDVNLAHTGASACMIDTEADGTELLITSGDDRIYSSNDCPKDEAIAATRLILEPKSQEDISVTWNRQRSLPKCATETATPNAGTYKASLTIQGIKSEVAVFNLA